MTLRQLMGHLAGVPSDDGDEGPLYGKHCEQPLDAVPAVAQNPLHFEPGTRFQYSSYGWILVSAAVEAAAQGPYVSTSCRSACLSRWECATPSPTPRRTPSPTA